MFNRRSFCLAAAAASAPGLGVAHHTGGGYQVPPEHMPRIVDLDVYHPAGEIHVDPNFYALYLTLPDYKAWRYSVGVAGPALWEPGEYHVQWKAKWPRWRPTDAMIRRNPAAYAKYRNGMPGGRNNPLGARALYLFEGDRDTYLRIHGTNKPWTIGSAVSNGCARLVNDHVIDLYERVTPGARVVLHPRWIDT
jgi:lipoprotein-anchoring transpeptidase ErfK/SrfK